MSFFRFNAITNQWQVEQLAHQLLPEPASSQKKSSRVAIEIRNANEFPIYVNLSCISASNQLVLLLPSPALQDNVTFVKIESNNAPQNFVFLEVNLNQWSQSGQNGQITTNQNQLLPSFASVTREKSPQTVMFRLIASSGYPKGGSLDSFNVSMSIVATV